MTGYSYDSIKYEAQQHFNRLADEAAAERLARESRGETASKRVDGPRWLGRIQPGWATRLIHTGTHASMARVS